MGKVEVPYLTPHWGDIPAKRRACVPKCPPAAGRRSGTQAWHSGAGVKREMGGAYENIGG